MLKKGIWRCWPLFLLFLFFVWRHWSFDFSLLFWCLGIIIGSFLLELDQIFYCFFQVPHEFASQRVQRLFQTGGWQGGIKFLQETKPERKRLVFHSALFQAALVAIGFFVLTSTASFLGKGLVMGACFQLLLEQGKEFRGKGQFNDWFWQFQNVPETRIQVFYFVLMGLVFLLFALFLI